ncbi:hypothetical protein [Candidatus Nitrosotenuis uzonensis]|uniref:Uncharacterized protein n=1 Tax=Candidatus Nitrosotenuis uzonensis TaxID=1407055 RepID=V6ASX8_9ARCH|nr:hypothetical protein [Candidatus Nitrosotenuis uzonensis]CDI05674.1 exported hypothetical protein [Candidatus Nitrosotenuis uzonensis]
MKSATKTRVAIISGIAMIVFVASFVGLPFIEESALQKAQQESIKKTEQSEERMLEVIAQEKAELEAKIGGRLSIP